MFQVNNCLRSPVLPVLGVVLAGHLLAPRLIEWLNPVASKCGVLPMAKSPRDVVCEMAIVKDAFYNKDICMPHLEEKDLYAIKLLTASAATGLLAPMASLAMRRYSFSGPGVLAKLENRDRCTLDGHEEQVVVMCNPYGRTNSTKPESGSDAVGEMYSKLKNCFPLLA
jgi:hypothetical protein